MIYQLIRGCVAVRGSVVPMGCVVLFKGCEVQWGCVVLNSCVVLWGCVVLVRDCEVLWGYVCSAKVLCSAKGLCSFV